MYFFWYGRSFGGQEPVEEKGGVEEHGVEEKGGVEEHGALQRSLNVPLHQVLGFVPGSRECPWVRGPRAFVWETS